MVRVQHALVIPTIPKPDHDNYSDSQGTTDAIREKPYAIHRREPMVLEGLDPVDRRKTERQSTDGQTDRRRLPIHESPLNVTVGILRKRSFAEASGEPNPAGEERERHAGEHVHIQEARFLLIQNIRPDRAMTMQLVGEVHPRPDESRFNPRKDQ